MKLTSNSTLQGIAPVLDVAGVLQLLESQHASGTFKLGDHWICLRDGQVTRTSGTDAVETMGALLTTQGTFTFRAVAGNVLAPGRSLTGLLLEAARISDEAQAHRA